MYANNPGSRGPESRVKNVTMCFTQTFSLDLTFMRGAFFFFWRCNSCHYLRTVTAKLGTIQTSDQVAAGF